MQKQIVGMTTIVGLNLVSNICSSFSQQSKADLPKYDEAPSLSIEARALKSAQFMVGFSVSSTASISVGSTSFVVILAGSDHYQNNQ
ncbi:MAG: hypothetical protein HYZ51_00890 [Candidatus Doudnabacteria bacterium]|nr:hypothetical protein [Candidatus Doudnabacteria bacterium]